jgi:hypothetical protein
MSEHLPATEPTDQSNALIMAGDPKQPEDQEFAEPVALSSAQPADRPPPRTALRLGEGETKPGLPLPFADASRASADS